MQKLSRKDQIRVYLERLQAAKTDQDIQAELGLTDASYRDLKETVIGPEIERVTTTTTEQTYVEYCLAQRGCIDDLNTLLDQYREAKNASAIVGAVKARSDILDKMIKLGQDFGIIEKKPEEKRLVAGVVVTQLSNDQLREAIADQISGLNSLVTQFGDHKLADIAPGELYREAPEPLQIEAKLEPEPEPKPPPVDSISERARRMLATPNPPVATDKRNRAKSNKVHRGRRVVKPPGR